MKKIQIVVETGLSVTARLVAIAESLGLKTEEAAVALIAQEVQHTTPASRRRSVSKAKKA